MQQILVGVDGSEQAMAAVDQAATIAAALDTNLHLFAVAPPIASVSEWLEFYRESGHLLDELPSLLSLVQPAFLDPAGERARAKGATKVSTQFTVGDPATEILVAVQEMKVDLVVVGSRGRGRFSGLLLGSVSQKLAIHAPCSVLIVR
jgi:nucleotide-binding universal stress UspA family protein